MRHDAEKIALTACAAGTLRRAARSLTRLYDAHLSPAGLTTTQFSILRTLQRHGGSMPLSTLAEDLVFERTSLYRVLAPLRNAGFVTVRPAADRRAKNVVLTPRAHRRIASAMPYWTAAQRIVLRGFGPTGWPDLAGRLEQLTAMALSSHGK
jgi:DNA-binding MarR family transcriptional regulator